MVEDSATSSRMERIKSYWEWEHLEEGIAGLVGNSSNCVQGYNAKKDSDSWVWVNHMSCPKLLWR